MQEGVTSVGGNVCPVSEAVGSRRHELGQPPVVGPGAGQLEVGGVLMVKARLHQAAAVVTPFPRPGRFGDNDETLP